MSWNIIFFKNFSGKEIVKDFIRSLEKTTISKVGRHIDLLQKNGPFLGMPYSKKISLQEIKTALERLKRLT